MLKIDKCKSYTELYDGHDRLLFDYNMLKLSYDRDEIPLYCCLSGSHSYGWDSPKSDLDVRSIHMIKNNDLLGISDHTKNVQYSQSNNDDILKINQNLDFVSYELGKFVNLMMMNVNTLEQLFSNHIIYIDKRFLRPYIELQNYALRFLSKQDLFNSYNGMTMHNYKKFILNGKQINNKEYLIVLRSGLCLQYALKNHIIEPNIYNVFKDYDLISRYTDKEIEIIEDLMKAKKLDNDNELVTSESILDSLITRMFELNRGFLDISTLQEYPTDLQKGIINEWVINTRKTIDQY